MNPFFLSKLEKSFPIVKVIFVQKHKPFGTGVMSIIFFDAADDIDIILFIDLLHWGGR